jgi:hypothetical protein
MKLIMRICTQQFSEDFCLLDCDTTQSGRLLTPFRMNLLPSQGIGTDARRGVLGSGP